MDLDMIEGLFGEREAEVVNDSEDDNNDSDDGGGQNYPDEEAVEVPALDAGGEAEGKTQETIKPKRIIKNPRPKLDVQRLMGPRGVPALQRTFKDVRWGGKGREREDLRELLRRLQHWAHRLYPAMPFSDTLAQIEKLGTKKNVKVHIKKLRLDMFVVENEGDGGEDNVRRWGDDEERQQEVTSSTPVVDVFDELLGTPAADPTVLPPVTSQSVEVLTAEQKERLEKNRRLAAERRMRRQQAEEEEDRAREEAMSQADWSPEQLFGTLKPMGNKREHDDANRDKKSLKNMETVEAQVTTLPTSHSHNTQLQDTDMTDTDMPASNLNSELQDTEIREMDVDSTDVLPSATSDTSIKSHPTHLTSSGVSDSTTTTNSGITVALSEGAGNSLCLTYDEPWAASGVENKNVACTQMNTGSRKDQGSENNLQNSNVMCKKSTSYPTSQLESVNQDPTLATCIQHMEGQTGSRTDHNDNGVSQCQSEVTDGFRDAGGREERGSQKQDVNKVMADLYTEDLMKMLED